MSRFTPCKIAFENGKRPSYKIIHFPCTALKAFDLRQVHSSHARRRFDIGRGFANLPPQLKKKQLRYWWSHWWKHVWVIVFASPLTSQHQIAFLHFRSGRARTPARLPPGSLAAANLTSRETRGSTVSMASRSVTPSTSHFDTSSEWTETCRPSTHLSEFC